jgi:hypothetical protein
MNSLVINPAVINSKGMRTGNKEMYNPMTTPKYNELAMFKLDPSQTFVSSWVDYSV